MSNDSAHLAEGSLHDGDIAVVLAAGKGTRMRSQLPKVLQLLAGKSMLERVLDTLSSVGFDYPAVVVGYGAEVIEQRMGARCAYISQGEQLGTGHAARVAIAALPTRTQRVVVVHGDEPMIGHDTYTEMLQVQRASGAPVVLLTTHLRDTHALGRVVRDAHGDAVALVQEGDLTAEQQSLTEVNLGAYVFDAEFLREALARLQPHAPKGEYYLTDVVERAVESGRPIATVTVPDGEDVMGANDLVQLEAATRVVYRRNAQRHQLNGVTLVDSTTTYIDDDVEIGADTVVHPFTILGRGTRIGVECEIGPGARIVSSSVGARSVVTASQVVESSIGEDCRVGPFAHLRRGSHLASGVEIGTGSEVKSSRLGQNTKMHHFGYVGDATIGANVNIGAGVVTCNYDGTQKHHTVVGNGAFIGSDTMLRAPVTVGDGGYTGAGSVVTRDVEPGSLVAGVPARVVRQGHAMTPSQQANEDHSDAAHERGT